MSDGEDLMAFQLDAIGLKGLYVREFRFDPTRRWRADFAFPAAMVLLEVEGGHWINGRHSRGTGFEADCEKYTIAAVLGYRVIRVTTGQVQSGFALQAVEAALGRRGMATPRPSHARNKKKAPKGL